VSRTLLTLLFVVVILPIPALAQQPEVLTEQEFQARLDAATRLNDEGGYDAALEAFRALLEVRPDDATVLCEMGNSYLAAGRASEAASAAGRGLDQKTANVAFCSNVLGSAYDAQGDLKRGEEVFRKAVKKAPDVALLRFNFGVNLAKQGRTADAIEQYEANLALRPGHASGWRTLGLAWQAMGERVKAFVAFARFLTLEPDSPRSSTSAKSLREILFEGVTDQGADPTTGKKQINIVLSPLKKGKDASDAQAVSLSIVAANRYTDEWKDKTDNQFFANAFETTLSILEELSASDNKEDPFWRERVMPYFRAARAAGHLEAMAWDIRRALKDPEIDQWIVDHADSVAKFRDWSKSWTHAP
jgi:tetratricopeptide (TPR) repeat protein